MTGACELCAGTIDPDKHANLELVFGELSTTLALCAKCATEAIRRGRRRRAVNWTAR